MRSCRTDAETVILDDETVIVERKFDKCANDKALHVEPWQAIWRQIVVHAETRQEAITVMEERIKRKKAIKQLEEYFRQRRIQQAVDDLLAKHGKSM
jgi:hypothetical protein